MVINSVKEISIGDTIEYSIWYKCIGYTGETKQFKVSDKSLALMKKYCSDEECRHHRFIKVN